MDVLGILVAVLLGLVVLAGIAFFGLVAFFIFKIFRKVFSDQKEFDKRWNDQDNFGRRNNR